MRGSRIARVLLTISLAVSAPIYGKASEEGSAKVAEVEKEDKPPAEVVILGTANFEHLTQAATGATTGDWFIEFYAPWCGHCKRLEPTWKELANELSTEVNVAKVDVTANRPLGTRFGIRGFPTLMFFRHETMYLYKGKRNLEAMAEFARGGYKAAEGMPVPAGGNLITTLKAYAETFVVDVAGITKGQRPKNSSIALFVGGWVVLLIFAGIIALVTSSGGGGGAAKPPAKGEDKPKKS
ncbi:unnamed protein product [Phaeothamnion confervicola]